MKKEANLTKIPTSPKQRKMAVVGSRSVGKSHLGRRLVYGAGSDVIGARKILPHSSVCGRPLRGQLLSYY